MMIKFINNGHFVANNKYLSIMVIIIIMMIPSITKQASINSDKHVNKIYHHQDAQKHVPKHPSLKSPKSKPPLLSFDHNFSINIRNDGGEIFRELITSNIINDYIQIKFEETDGSLIQQILDFKNNIQLFRIARLGEQDLQEQKVQLFCFVTRLSTTTKTKFKKKTLIIQSDNDNQQNHQQQRSNNAGEDDDIDGDNDNDHQHQNNVDSRIDDDDGGGGKDQNDNDNGGDYYNDNDDDDDDDGRIQDFVSPQLMSRLSQKNPGAIRYADEDRGQQSYHMDLEILIDHNDDGNDDDGDDGNILGTKRHRKSKSKSTIPIISPHIKDNCVTNQDWPTQNHHHHYRIYASYDDFRHWTDGHRTFANISNAIKKLNYSTNQANNNNDSKLTNNNDGVGVQSNRNNQKFRLRSSLQQQQKHSNLTNNEQQMENKLKLANQNQERMRCGQIISNWMFNNNNNNDGHQLESSQVTNQSNSLLSSILMIKSMFNNHHRHQQQQQPCHCSLNIFIPWYVCGVRYCPIQQQSDQQQQQQQNTQRYRCGVRTCRKRYQFTFAVPNHIHCLSDFDPTLSSDTMMAFDNFIINNNDNEIESLSNDQNRSIQI